MSQLVIIGASAMGREAFLYAQDCDMAIKGFLDSRKGILNGYRGYPAILSSPEMYHPSPEDVFVCAVGDGEQRRKYVECMEMKGGRFVSIIHPKAYVGRNVSIGAGCIICPNSTLTADIHLGSHVIINANSSIGHDCNIGDFATLSPGCHVAGWCSIGCETFMGVHSALIPHVSTGPGVYIAGGAVVTSSVATGRVMGVPAIPK